MRALHRRFFSLNNFIVRYMVLPNVFNQKNKTLSECRNEGSNIFIVWKIKNGIKKHSSTAKSEKVNTFAENININLTVYS